MGRSAVHAWFATTGRDRRNWSIVLAAWLTFGAAQALFESALQRSSLGTLWRRVVIALVLATLWSAITYGLGAWLHVSRTVIRSRRWRIATHLPLVLAVGIVLTGARRVLVLLLGGSLGVPFEATLLYFADLTLMSYVAAIMIARTVEVHDALMARERRTLRLREELSRAQVDVLELQLRPHFLFNALGTITELAHEAPKSAIAMLRNLGDLLRAAIDDGGRAEISLDDELRLLEPYLAIQRIRFADWLTIEVHVASDVCGAAVPRLILQPLVENAVRHGLDGRSAPGRITIRATAEAGALRLMVEDNGVGLRNGPTRAGHGAGLRNVRERLQALHGDDARLELREHVDGGVVAELSLPLHQAVTLPMRTVAATGVPDEQRTDEPEPDTLGAGGTSEGTAEDLAPSGWAAVGIWFLVGAFWVHQSIGYALLRNRLGQVRIGSAILRDLSSAFIWAVLAPAVVWLSRRMPVERPRRALALLIHAIAAAIMAVIVSTGSRLIGGGAGEPFISVEYTSLYIANIGIYAIVAGIAHTRRLRAWIRERDLAASRLRAEIQSARLRRLTVELRPQVVLSTLQRLGEIVGRDTRRAERLVSRLGVLLRGALEGMARPHVTLAQELAVARAYGDVLAESVRPSFSIDIASVASAERGVPTGIVRSLVDVLADQWQLGGHVLRLAFEDEGDDVLIKAMLLGPRPSVSGEERERTIPPALAALLRDGIVRQAQLTDARASLRIPTWPHDEFAKSREATHAEPAPLVAT
jgi:two-component system, LytTR family, sensor kinase